MSATWSALAEPHRREMLSLLLETPRAVGELARLSGLSQPGTSKHLRVLRDAGLVRSRTDGQRRVYLLNPEPFVELDGWLTPYRQLWEHRLDMLEQHLERKAISEEK
jgi:DNA-binding transcriptional ArsR family regulator